MTNNADGRNFKDSGPRKRIDKLFTKSGEGCIEGDELAVARVAYDARRAETVVPVAPGLLTYAALAVAIMTAAQLDWWMGLILGVIGAAALWANFAMAKAAGDAAAAQAVAEDRRARKLAAVDSAGARAAAITQPTATELASRPVAVNITQAPSRATDKALAAIAITAMVSAAAMAAAALLRRP